MDVSPWRKGRFNGNCYERSKSPGRHVAQLGANPPEPAPRRPHETGGGGQREPIQPWNHVACCAVGHELSKSLWSSHLLPAECLAAWQTSIAPCCLKIAWRLPSPLSCSKSCLGLVVFVPDLCLSCTICCCFLELFSPSFCGFIIFSRLSQSTVPTVILSNFPLYFSGRPSSGGLCVPPLTRASCPLEPLGGVVLELFLTTLLDGRYSFLRPMLFLFYLSFCWTTHTSKWKVDILKVWLCGKIFILL